MRKYIFVIHHSKVIFDSTRTDLDEAEIAKRTLAAHSCVDTWNSGAFCKSIITSVIYYIDLSWSLRHANIRIYMYTHAEANVASGLR